MDEFVQTPKVTQVLGHFRFKKCSPFFSHVSGFYSLATALVGPRVSSGMPSSAGRASILGQLVLGYLNLFEAGFLVLYLTSQEAEA
eukprot:2943260-Amphidinium_carterae.1